MHVLAAYAHSKFIHYNWNFTLGWKTSVVPIQHYTDDHTVLADAGNHNLVTGRFSFWLGYRTISQWSIHTAQCNTPGFWWTAEHACTWVSDEEQEKQIEFREYMKEQCSTNGSWGPAPSRDRSHLFTCRTSLMPKRSPIMNQESIRHSLNNIYTSDCRELKNIP